MTLFASFFSVKAGKDYLFTEIFVVDLPFLLPKYLQHTIICCNFAQN